MLVKYHFSKPEKTETAKTLFGIDFKNVEGNWLAEVDAKVCASLVEAGRLEEVKSEKK